MNSITGHERVYIANKKKLIAILASLIIMVSALSSVVFIAVEANHRCSDQDCPICACIHEAEEAIRNLGMAAAGSIILFILPALFLLAASMELQATVPTQTLITEKVRLNN